MKSWSKESLSLRGLYIETNISYCGGGGGGEIELCDIIEII